MRVTCPNCQRQVEFHLFDGSLDIDGVSRVKCPQCQILLRLLLKVEVMGVQTQRDASRIQIVVAVDGEATRELIRETLSGAGYEVLEAATGKEALFLCEKHHPALALLDVGLPEMFGFQVCDAIKQRESLKNIKVILVAAIHNKSTYRRQPRTLYGADDYIERHQLQGDLLTKIQAVLDIAVPRVSREAMKEPAQRIPNKELSVEAGGKKHPSESRADEEPVAVVAQETRTTVSPYSPPQSPRLPHQPETEDAAGQFNSPEHESARRLARTIVSDIAIYNSDRVKEAIKQGNFYEVLREEIEEGRKLYNERVSTAVRSTADYFQEALDHYIHRQKKTG